MLIQSVTVKAGRTVNHPHESYSNLRQDVEIVALVAEDESAEEVVKSLQQRAEQLVEDHKNNLLKSIEDLREMEMREREAASLSRSIAEAQAKLDRLRESQRPILELNDNDWQAPS